MNVWKVEFINDIWIIEKSTGTGTGTGTNIDNKNNLRKYGFHFTFHSLKWNLTFPSVG